MLEHQHIETKVSIYIPFCLGDSFRKLAQKVLVSERFEFNSVISAVSFGFSFIFLLLLDD